MQLSAKRAGEGAYSFVAFTVGSVRYALDIAHVREIVTPLSLTKLPHTPGGLAGVADHRSEVVPVINLRARFNLPDAIEPNRKAKWILVTVAGKTVGLVVDDVLGVLRVSVSEFRPPPELGGGDHARGITNVTTYEGQLVFVLDLSKFEKLAESFDHQSLLPNGAASEEDA